jgi:hypothetical protein
MKRIARTWFDDALPNDSLEVDAMHFDCDKAAHAVLISIKHGVREFTTCFTKRQALEIAQFITEQFEEK